MRERGRGGAAGAPMEFRRSSTADQLASAIRKQVMAGELKPGSPVREAAIAESAGVSRNTVREALRILAAEGLVQHRVNYGMVVTALTIEDVADIYGIRSIFEPLAMSTLLSQKKPDFTPLRAAVGTLRDATRSCDSESILEADFAFHRSLVAYLGNRRVDQIYGAILVELRLVLAAYDATSAADDSIYDHERLLSLAEAGSRRAAVEAVREHLDQARRQILQYMADQPS